MNLTVLQEVGRYDVCIHNNVDFATIFEFKVKHARTKESLEELANSALYQIEEKRYDENVKKLNISNIFKHGIAFSTTDVIVK